MNRRVAGVRVTVLSLAALDIAEESLFERNLSEEERAKIRTYVEDRYCGQAVPVFEDLTVAELRCIKDYYAAVLDAVSRSAEKETEEETTNCPQSGRGPNDPGSSSEDA